MAITAPAYTPATGLSSNLNDTEIIASLVAIRQAPITQLGTEETTMQTQVSELGTQASNLTALQQAADALSTNGVVAAKVTSTNTAFTATAGTQATAGQYSVQVTSVATAAKARSDAFTSSSAGVTGGTLNLTVQGTGYSLAVTDGESLSAVAQALNQLGAPITANVLSDGTSSYLEVINSQTGYPVGSSAAQGLAISETTTGTQGQALNLSVIETPTNSALTVDGLSIKETTNAISDVIPGVTLNLTSTDSAAENLVVQTDSSGTQTNLAAFVSAYNTLNAALQDQLNPPATTDSSGNSSVAPAPLSNDATVQDIEQQMQQIVTTIVPGVTGFNSLASIGITTSDQDGSMSIDTAQLNNAINSNPAAVNELFSKATSGISAAFDHIATSFADPADGALTLESQHLTSRVAQMTAQQSQLQTQLTAYQANLQEQFANMETLESSYKSVGNYLTQLSDAQTASSSS